MLLRLAAFPLLIAAVLAGLAWMNYTEFLKQPVTIAADSESGAEVSTSGSAASMLFTVERGWSFNRVANELVARGVLDSPWWFRLYGRLSKQESAIKAGEYSLEPGLTPPALMSLLTSGQTTQYSGTVIEGYNFRQMMEKLVENGHLRHSADLKPLRESMAVDASALMATLGKPDVHPEGQFFADTYRFDKGSTDVAFLQRATDMLDRVLTEEWEARDADLPFDDPYQALILASIVEKETAVAEERPIIAGVFISRLRRNMRLQTDPTVIYGMGDAFDGNIRRSDLTTDTPYNTYTRGGLPPTPIAMVGRDAIHAVMHPAETTALYFVSKGDGTHQFSDTVEQHNAAVAQYQLRRKKSNTPGTGQ